MEKLIVLDLDGTLLKKDKTVSSYTVETLLKFKKMGNKILFATARPPRDAYKYVPIELRNNPIICYNGACILNGEEILYANQINKKDTLEIIGIAEKLGYIQISMEIDDTLYSNFDASEFFGNAPNQIVDFAKLDFKNIYKLMVCSKKKIVKKLVDELPKSCRGVITDNGTICQIANYKVSKWNSVKLLAEEIGIKAKNIIAFGDDYNDFDMIKNAGMGVAMKNAEQEIKENADFITDSNDNDGVAKFIEKNLF